MTSGEKKSKSSLDSLYDISLSENEINSFLDENIKDSKVITSKYELDKFEQYIVYLTGIIAGAVDAFFVTDVNILKNSKGITIRKDGKSIHLNESGEINKFVDKRIKNIYSPSEIKQLENKYWVPYDPSTSKGLEIPIEGLSPKTHRISSLGHDPVLGFYYGVKDILNGTFTAINNNGDIITQQRVGIIEPYTIFEAISIQFGHLCSDISTSASLPIPFMSQLMRLKGNTDVNGLSYPMLIKSMYLKGYNLNHFIAMGVPSMIIEIIIRTSYFVYSLSQGKSFKESLPFNSPKLERMLFRSYAIASACNGIKIYASGGNIFAFNPTLYGQMIKYGFGELKRWFTNEAELKRHQYVYELYNKQSQEIDDEINLLLEFYNK